MGIRPGNLLPKHRRVTIRLEPVATVMINNNNENLYDSIYEDAYDWIVTGPEIKEQETEQSNKILRQQMRVLKRTKGKLCKNGCGKWIYLQEDTNGKWHPHNKDDNEFHRCSKKPSTYKCHNCGKNIVFDRDKVSESGKSIHLNESDHSPHQCLNDPF